MSSNKTDWRHVLPINRFEMWIIRIWLVFSTMCVGAVIALVFMQFFTHSNFKGGAEFMQNAYTTKGMVVREINK